MDSWVLLPQRSTLGCAVQHPLHLLLGLCITSGCDAFRQHNLLNRAIWLLITLCGYPLPLAKLVEQGLDESKCFVLPRIDEKRYSTVIGIFLLELVSKREGLSANNCWEITMLFLKVVRTDTLSHFDWQSPDQRFRVTTDNWKADSRLAGGRCWEFLLNDLGCLRYSHTGSKTPWLDSSIFVSSFTTLNEVSGSQLQ